MKIDIFLHFYLSIPWRDLAFQFCAILNIVKHIHLCYEVAHKAFDRSQEYFTKSLN